MTASERAAFLQSGRGLTAALAIIALLAFVLPSVLASRLQQSRLSRARQQVSILAQTLAGAGLDQLTAKFKTDDIGVLSGAGDPIVRANDSKWLTARLAPLASYVTLSTEAVDPDPWLRAIVINVGAWHTGGTVWVLSAGPDGIVETPFTLPSGSGAVGDDIAAPLP